MTLKELRISQGLSQSEMGAILGKSRGSINAYELGKTKIPDEVYAKIFERFGVELTSTTTTPSPDDIQPADTETKVAPMDGTILKDIRSAHNLSQVKMAEIIGKSPSSVINYEKGVSMVPVDAVHRLEKWLATQSASTTPATTTPTPAQEPEKVVEEKPKEKPKEKGVEEKTEKAGPHVYIQSMAGSTISLEDIIARVIDVVPSVDNIYVKPEENRAYWTAGKNNGSTVLW